MALGAISFDIDGVLVDATKRLDVCLNGAEVDWDCFLDCRKLALDAPKSRNIELARLLSSRGYVVVVVTGRPEYMRSCTEEQLKLYGVPHRRLYMRPMGDRRRDHIYKAEVISALAGRLGLWAHFDDNIETVMALKALGIDAVLAY
ncbi:MAG: acid phosphatase [Thermoproteus sp.]